MGLGDYWNALAEMRVPKPQFSIDNVPDLKGKIVLITGGNSGIGEPPFTPHPSLVRRPPLTAVLLVRPTLKGKETAKVLLEHNAKVYIACRSSEKGAAAVKDLLERTGKTSNDLVVLSMDLSSLRSVKMAVDEFLANESHLDILYLSAGIMWPHPSLLTTEGYDVQFGTNVLGHFYLTRLLLPILLSTASSSPDSEKHVRVVSLASNAHWGAPGEKNGGPVLYETLVGGAGRERRGLGTEVLYNQSKAGNVLFANALARKYGGQGIVSISLNPGMIDTDLTRHASSFVRWLLLHTVLHPISSGILTGLYAGTAPEAAELNGKYLVPWARVRYARKDMESIEHQERLWAWCEEQVKKIAD